MNNLLIEEKKYLGNVIRTILDQYIIELIQPGNNIGYIKSKISEWIEQFGVLSIKGFFIDDNFISVPVHISTNDVLCHGMTNDDYVLTSGELIRIDLVVFRHGLYADAARTYCVGIPNEEQLNLLKVIKLCVDRVINEVHAGDYISKIAKIITQTATENNLFLAPANLCGHAIGEKLHMNPTVLNYYNEYYFKNHDSVINVGDVLCVEPILSTIKIDKIYEDNKQQLISKNFPGYIAHYEQMIQFEFKQNIVYTGN